MQPSPPLRCEMAVRAAALAQARTAELLGVPAPASHQSTSCSGRCKKQTGPALFAPGNSRAASAIPPAAWLTHRVPARPPPASVLHLPSLPLGAGLVCAKRRRGFPSEHQRIFSKGQRFLRAHLPLAPSLFVFFFFIIICFFFFRASTGGFFQRVSASSALICPLRHHYFFFSYYHRLARQHRHALVNAQGIPRVPRNRRTALVRAPHSDKELEHNRPQQVSGGHFH